MRLEISRNSNLLFLQVIFTFCMKLIESKHLSPTQHLEDISNDVVYLRHHVTRVRRQNSVRSKLTAPQIEESLDIQNELRRLEDASDMEHLKYNSYLADMVQEWMEGCVWGHGNPDRDPEEMPFNPVGQNLYFTTGSLNITRAHWLFYNEKENYNYTTMICKKDTQCGHYTQLTWAKSREVGCGLAFCETLVNAANGKIYKNAQYYGCNFGPAGNYQGQRPYQKGPACSRCPTGQFWCDTTQPRGLCRRDCESSNAECVCGAECANGGSTGADCTCMCSDGWHGDSCTKECVNNNAQCGVGYPRWYCDDETYGDAIQRLCPLLCEVCKAAPSTTALSTQLTTPSTVTTSTMSTTQNVTTSDFIMTSGTTAIETSTGNTQSFSTYPRTSTIESSTSPANSSSTQSSTSSVSSTSPTHSNLSSIASGVDSSTTPIVLGPSTTSISSSSTMIISNSSDSSLSSTSLSSTTQSAKTSTHSQIISSTLSNTISRVSTVASSNTVPSTVTTSPNLTVSEISTSSDKTTYSMTKPFSTQSSTYYTSSTNTVINTTESTISLDKSTHTENTISTPTTPSNISNISISTKASATTAIPPNSTTATVLSTLSPTASALSTSATPTSPRSAQPTSNISDSSTPPINTSTSLTQTPLVTTITTRSTTATTPETAISSALWGIAFFVIAIDLALLVVAVVTGIIVRKRIVDADRKRKYEAGTTHQAFSEDGESTMMQPPKQRYIPNNHGSLRGFADIRRDRVGQKTSEESIPKETTLYY